MKVTHEIGDLPPWESEEGEESQRFAYVDSFHCNSCGCFLDTDEEQCELCDSFDPCE